MARHFFLVGFMGSGKTHWGKVLAEHLDVPFIDLDEFIEASEGKSIADIFSEKGESGFRTLERAYLRQIAAQPPAVVATGGGTPCFFDNMDWMNMTGTTLYLRVSTNVLFERLKREIASRPLLKGFSEADLQAFIERLLAERTPFYLRAKTVLEPSDDDGDTLKNLLAAYLAF